MSITSGLYADAWARLRGNRLALSSAALLAVVALACMVGPWLLPWPYAALDLDNVSAPPSVTSGHWLGTDSVGRDLLARTLVGGRVSLLVGIVATTVSLVIGVAWGTVAGYLGGRTDEIMMRIVDVLYALPFMFFVILLMVLFGRNLVLIFVAIGAINWLDMARIVRGETRSLARREFVDAARVGGLSTARILVRHIVPNLLGVVVVYITLTIPQVILVESFLSFLGLGVQEPMTSWGGLVNDGAADMQVAPWALIVPGTLLALTLTCLNALGDGLRDALDPRSAP